MPTLNELRARIHTDSHNTLSVAPMMDELLVDDRRAQLTPKEQVESRVWRALEEMEQRTSLIATYIDRS